MLMPEGMKRSLKRLHDDGQESDVTIKADGQEWKVHKLVLLMHSPFLHGLASETQGSTIELQGVDKAHAAALVYFFYHLDYKSGSQYPLTFDVHMHKLAETYSIADLVTLTVKKVAKMKWVAARDFGKAVRELYAGDLDAFGSMKDAMAKISFNDHIGLESISPLLDIKDFAEDMYICASEKLKAAEKDATALQQYKHCRPFYAKFSDEYEASSDDGMDDPAADHYRHRKQFACPYCYIKLPLAVWEDHLAVKKDK